jgi:hypothetical protein
MKIFKEEKLLLNKNYENEIKNLKIENEKLKLKNEENKILIENLNKKNIEFESNNETLLNKINTLKFSNEKSK